MTGPPVQGRKPAVGGALMAAALGALCLGVVWWAALPDQGLDLDTKAVAARPVGSSAAPARPTAAAAVSPPARAPSLDPSHFVTDDFSGARRIALHPSWCAPSPLLPFAPFGDIVIRHGDYYTDTSADEWGQIFLHIKRQDYDTYPGSYLPITADCALLVPPEFSDPDVPVCLVRHNAVVRCAPLGVLPAVAPGWAIELLPYTTRHPPCALSIEGGPLAHPADPEIIPLTHINVYGFRLPLPPVMPRALCQTVIDELEMTQDAENQVSYVIGGTAPVATVGASAPRAD